MQKLPVLLILACAATLSAQTIIPLAAVPGPVGGSTGNIWRTTLNRTQAIYDTTNFPGATGPITFGVMETRAIAVGVSGSYASVEIRMSSSTTDFLAPSTTFATNRGVDDTVVYSGPVNFAQGLGWNVHIDFTTPFTYDPTLGADLIVEIVLNSTPSATPPTQDSAFTPATHLCQVVRSLGSAVATTGALSGFAPALRFGPVGAVFAESSKYGSGCYGTPGAFFELFDGTTSSFDLNGTTVFMDPNANGGYDVYSVPVANIVTPVAAGLGLTDDSIANQAIPFAFPFAGGTTSSLGICSNGYIWLQASTVADFSPTVAELIAQPARLCMGWQDLNPGAVGSGNVHVDIDASNAFVTITYNNVLRFGSTTDFNTMQVVLNALGQIEVRYATVVHAATPLLAGYTPGQGNFGATPAPTDLSAAIPFSTSFGFPETLDVVGAPVVGTTISFDTSSIPAAAVWSTNMLSFVVNNPGIDLTSLGAPGCFQYIGNDDPAPLTLVPVGGFASRSVALPADPSWLNAILSSQSASLMPGVNALGAVTSNGVRFKIGNL